ncbi:MAG: hypothetical protein IJ716_09220 [Lachnospiraceae bacterium]|nr:hypothetical protein [Lachnospiraceae bacterium]
MRTNWQNGGIMDIELTGIYWGYFGIPSEWIEGLRERESIEDAVNALCQNR